MDMRTSPKRKWQRKQCDRCGSIKFVRNWFGVAVMCQECIKASDKESQE